MNLRVPWNAGNFLTSCKPVSFSRRTLHHGVRSNHYEELHLKYLCNLARYDLRTPWGWHSSVKRYRSSIINCQLIVHWLVTVQNKKKCSRHFSNIIRSSVQAGKDKSVSWQAWRCPEISRKLRFPHNMTTAQDVDKFVSLTHRPPLPPGNAAGTHFC